MTISSTSRKSGPYVGNGSTSAFPFDFKVFRAEDIRVVLADTAGAESDLALTTDYTVTLNPDQNANPGGTITTQVALAAGWRLTLTSAVPDQQPTDITNMGGFYPQVIEDALDRLTILLQQAAEQLGRAVKVPISSSLNPGELIAQLTASVAEAVTAAETAGNAALSAEDSAEAAQAAAASAESKVSLTGAYADPSWITSLSGAKLNAGSVTTAKFAADAKAPYAGAADSATTAGSATTASTANAIADGAVSTAAKLAIGVVTTPKLADGSVSAAKLDGAQSGAAPIYAARAWVNFNGTGTVAIRASGNVSSITDNGLGDYTINFATAMPDANYAALLSGAASLNDASNFMRIDSQIAAGLRFRVGGINTSNYYSSYYDNPTLNVAIFR